MLLKKLNFDIISAMKEKNIIKKDILRLIVGEVQNSQAKGVEFTDEQIESVIRKTIEANKETLSYNECKNSNQLTKENNILESYLSKTMTQQEISVVLSDIEFTGNFGKDMSIAMAYLKKNGYKALGSDVKKAILLNKL